MDVSSQLLQRHAVEGNAFLLDILVVMNTGSKILTPKQNERAWNGTVLHFLRRRSEQYPWLVKL
jgi:hypothetical protein